MCPPNLFTSMKDHIGPCRAILPQRLDWNWFYSHVIYTHCIEWKCSWQLSPISAPRGGQSVWRRRGSILIHSILTSQEEQKGGQAYPCDLQQLNSKTYSGRMVAGLPLATGSPHLGLVLHQQDTSPGQGTQPAGTPPVKNQVMGPHGLQLFAKRSWCKKTD